MPKEKWKIRKAELSKKYGFVIARWLGISGTEKHHLTAPNDTGTIPSSHVICSIREEGREHTAGRGRNCSHQEGQLCLAPLFQKVPSPKWNNCLLLLLLMGPWSRPVPLALGFAASVILLLANAHSLRTVYSQGNHKAKGPDYTWAERTCWLTISWEKRLGMKPIQAA